MCFGLSMFCWIYWNNNLRFLCGCGKIGNQITTAVIENLYSLLNLNPAIFVFTSFHFCSFKMVLSEIYTNLGGGGITAQNILEIHYCVSQSSRRMTQDIVVMFHDRT